MCEPCDSLDCVSMSGVVTNECTGIGGVPNVTLGGTVPLNILTGN